MLAALDTARPPREPSFRETTQQCVKYRRDIQSYAPCPESSLGGAFGGGAFTHHASSKKSLIPGFRRDSNWLHTSTLPQRNMVEKLLRQRHLRVTFIGSSPQRHV